MNRSRLMVMLTVVLAGAWCVLTFMPSLLLAEWLSESSVLGNLFQALVERQRQLSPWQVSLLHSGGLACGLFILYQAWNSFTPTLSLLMQRRRMPSSRYVGSRLLRRSKMVCGITGMLLFPALTVQLALKLLAPLWLDAPSIGPILPMAGAGIAGIFTLLLLSVHLVSVLLLVIGRYRHTALSH